MSSSFLELKRSFISERTFSSPSISFMKSNESPKILTNLILKAPPESHKDPETQNFLIKFIGFEKFNPVDQPDEPINSKYEEKNAHLELCEAV